MRLGIAKPMDGRNNDPHFGLKSLYIVFGLQGVLAWIISIPLLFALYSVTGFHWLDAIAVALWLVGFIFESVADWQLFRFKRDDANKGKVLERRLT